MQDRDFVFQFVVGESLAGQPVQFQRPHFRTNRFFTQRRNRTGPPLLKLDVLIDGLHHFRQQRRFRQARERRQLRFQLRQLFVAPIGVRRARFAFELRPQVEQPVETAGSLCQIVG